MMETVDGVATETGTTTKRILAMQSKNGVCWIPACEASAGETVRWSVGTRKVSIFFPTPGVFPTQVLASQATGDIDVVVPMTAKPGRYEYMIYCHDTDQFATCNSHPILVIPVPN
jgi:hypothetical protein